jgi:hypothetical protein
VVLTCLLYRVGFVNSVVAISRENLELWFPAVRPQFGIAVDSWRAMRAVALAFAGDFSVPIGWPMSARGLAFGAAAEIPTEQLSSSSMAKPFGGLV